jgi:hypothetical protein
MSIGGITCGFGLSQDFLLLRSGWISVEYDFKEKRLIDRNYAFSDALQQTLYLNARSGFV